MGRDETGEDLQRCAKSSPSPTLDRLELSSDGTIGPGGLTGSAPSSGNELPLDRRLVRRSWTIRRPSSWYTVVSVLVVRAHPGGGRPGGSAGHTGQRSSEALWRPGRRRPDQLLRSARRNLCLSPPERHREIDNCQELPSVSDRLHGGSGWIRRGRPSHDRPTAHRARLQEQTLDDQLTAEENCRFRSFPYGVQRDHAVSRIARALVVQQHSPAGEEVDRRVRETGRDPGTSRKPRWSRQAAKQLLLRQLLAGSNPSAESAGGTMTALHRERGLSRRRTSLVFLCSSTARRTRPCALPSSRPVLPGRHAPLRLPDCSRPAGLGGVPG